MGSNEDFEFLFGMFFGGFMGFNFRFIAFYSLYTLAILSIYSCGMEV